MVRSIALVALVSALVGGVVGGVVLMTERATGTDLTRTTGKALIGGPFTLVNQDGKTVTQDDFKGKPMIIYFGFTHCPDICPSSLQVVTAALEELGDKADRINPVLISVDPARDTPNVLKEYVSAFDPRLMGLTGSEAQVQDVIKTYRVYARKVALEDSATDYTMDHSSFYYLVDADGQFVTHFTHNITAEKLAAGIAKHLDG